MMVFIGIVAWSALTCLPVATAICCWKLAGYIRHGWIVHVGFLPVLLSLVWLFDRLLFWAAHDDGEGPPGLGLVLIPAFLAFLVTVPVYYGALAIRALHRLARARRTAFGRVL